MVMYLRLRLDELPDDGIVSGGHRVEDPVNPLQRLLVLHVHSTTAQENVILSFGVLCRDVFYTESRFLSIPDPGSKNNNIREG